METGLLEPTAETPEETPPDNPATPEPDGPNPPQDDPPVEPPKGAEPGETLYHQADDTDLSLDAGGKAPTDSKLAIVGRSIEVEGQVKKGDTIRATVELRVGGVKFQDKEDSATSQVVASTRTHYARIVGYARQK